MNSRVTIGEPARDRGIARTISGGARRPHRGWLAFALARWPTALAIAFAVLVAYDLEGGSSLYFLLLISPLCYLAAAALDRPWTAWAVLLASIPAVVLMRVLGIEPALGLSVAAAIFLALGLTHWRRQGTWGIPLQTIGMVAFGAVGVAVLAIDAPLSGYLVAAGLVGHSLWDIAHYRANKVAVRSFTEWCAVYDLLIAGAIIFLA